MEDAGQRLKKVRERLGLRYRDVEAASLEIARLRNNDEFVIALSRLADIENKGTVPTIYRMYSLCAIYRLDMVDVLQWFGVDLSLLAGDAGQLELERTHLIGISESGNGSVRLPLALDPGIDLRKTTHLSRFIQRWGSLPLMLLNGIDLPGHRYGFIGTEDWSMHPILSPGALLLLDESRRKPEAQKPWTSEFDRPIFMIEDREGFRCGWCQVDRDRLILMFHPASMIAPLTYAYPGELDVIGQVTGVAMRLDRARRPRIRP